jgi:hypothetical protein
LRARSITALTLFAAFVAACGNNPATSPSAAAGTSAGASAAPSAAASAPASQSTSVGSLEDVKAAADATIAKETVSVDQTIEFTGNTQIPDGTTARLTGSTAFTKPTQLAATADFSALGVGQFDMIVDDELVYVNGSIVEPLVGDKWLRVDITSDDPRAAGFASLATGQNDSSLLLYFLYGASDPVQALPDETIDGQAMHRLSMSVDLDVAVEQAPANAREALQANVAGLESEGMDTTVQADVWIGDDGLIHRVQYEYTLGSANGGGNLLTRCDFADFGEPLDLGIPADADVVDLEDVQAG